MKRPLIISPYWICQLAGWTFAGCFWMLSAYLSVSFHWKLFSLAVRLFDQGQK